jgi:hypothetical protein
VCVEYIKIEWTLLYKHHNELKMPHLFGHTYNNEKHTQPKELIYWICERCAQVKQLQLISKATERV